MAFEAAGAQFSPAEIPARCTRVGFDWGNTAATQLRMQTVARWADECSSKIYLELMAGSGAKPRPASEEGLTRSHPQLAGGKPLLSEVEQRRCRPI